MNLKLFFSIFFVSIFSPSLHAMTNRKEGSSPLSELFNSSIAMEVRSPLKNNASFATSEQGLTPSPDNVRSTPNGEGDDDDGNWGIFEENEFFVFTPDDEAFGSGPRCYVILLLISYDHNLQRGSMAALDENKNEIFIDGKVENLTDNFNLKDAKNAAVRKSFLQKASRQTPQAPK